jgi:hypothetical protein
MADFPDIKFPDAKTAIRIIVVLALLAYFYVAGLPLEIIALIGIMFAGFFFLRGKIWKAAERAIEKHLPFTKKWPEWGHKAVVLILFIVLYLLLKQVIYMALGFAGIDVEQIIMKSVQAKFA